MLVEARPLPVCYEGFVRLLRGRPSLRNKLPRVYAVIDVIANGRKIAREFLVDLLVGSSGGALSVLLKSEPEVEGGPAVRSAPEPTARRSVESPLMHGRPWGGAAFFCASW